MKKIRSGDLKELFNRKLIDVQLGDDEKIHYSDNYMQLFSVNLIDIKAKYPEVSEKLIPQALLMTILCTGKCEEKLLFRLTRILYSITPLKKIKEVLEFR